MEGHPEKEVLSSVEGWEDTETAPRMITEAREQLCSSLQAGKKGRGRFRKRSRFLNRPDL